MKYERINVKTCPPPHFLLCHCQTEHLNIQLLLGGFSYIFIVHISAKKKKKMPGQVRSGHQSEFVDQTGHLRRVCYHVRAGVFSRNDFLS